MKIIKRIFSFLAMCWEHIVEAIQFIGDVILNFVIDHPFIVSAMVSILTTILFHAIFDVEALLSCP